MMNTNIYILETSSSLWERVKKFDQKLAKKSQINGTCARQIVCGNRDSGIELLSPDIATAYLDLSDFFQIPFFNSTFIPIVIVHFASRVKNPRPVRTRLYEYRN